MIQIAINLFDAQHSESTEIQNRLQYKNGHTMTNTATSINY